MGIDEAMLQGKVVRKNYRSAYENKEKVTDALAARVRAGKTLKLGEFSGRAADLPGKHATVSSLGAQ